MNNDREKYLEAYYNNEYDANRQMAYALLLAAVLIAGVWIGFLVGLFNITREILIVISIGFPISISILISPLFYLKTEKIKKPTFKYFVLYSFIFVIALLNIIVPKHAILAWAICIILANHYYNPKVGKKVFITCLIAMLICIYLAMFLGEYDSNLLTGQSSSETELIYNYQLDKTYPDTPSGRFDYLHDLKAIGVNRYVDVLLFYYLSRFICLVITFFVSNSLNKRTYKLLIDEIKVNSEQQKTNTELDVAKEIQLQTLPREFVTNKDIEIQAELKAARMVGGDFYDYFDLDNDHVAIVIGDVSGKGIGAAMFMMKTITCFKNFADIRLSPKETLEKVNKQIYNEKSDMFVTAFYAIVNVKTGHVRFANAGHTKPVVGQNRKFHFLSCDTGFILGAMEDAYVVDDDFYLEHGDSITLYTDGITEAKNINDELFGEANLLNVFNAADYSCLLDLHGVIKEAVSSFSEGTEQSDDITYITLKFHGDEYEYDEKIFEGTADIVPDMLSFLSAFAEKNGFEPGFTNNLMVVGDEMFSNIFKHGYPDNKGAVYLRALYNIDKKEFNLAIIDAAIEFDPFKADVDNNQISDISVAKEGGLGIMIVKKLMSEYAYDRINGKNIIVLKKKF